MKRLLSAAVVLASVMSGPVMAGEESTSAMHPSPQPGVSRGGGGQQRPPQAAPVPRNYQPDRNAGRPYQPDRNTGRHYQPDRPVGRPYQPEHRYGDGGGRGRGPVIIFSAPSSYPSWTRSFGYEERYHDVCQRKAWRLRWFERRAASDGYFDEDEREEMRDLRRDLRRSCGDYRWR